MQHSKLSVVGLLIVAQFFTGPIHAEDDANTLKENTWIVRTGYANINPQSNNGDIANVGDQSNFTTTFVYFLNNNIGIEVLAGFPFRHNIYDKALGTGLKIGSASHLPPTVTLQYYFDSSSKLQPYFGLGLNHTLFFKEKASGPLSGADIRLGSSTDLSLQVGFDYELSNNRFLNLDIRKIQINSKATVTNIGNTALHDVLPDELVFDVPIDPLVIGINLAWKF